MLHHSPGPDQHAALLIHGHALSVDEFVLKGFAGLVVDLQLQLQRPIRHASPAPKQLDDLGDHRIKVHHRPSTCASAASAWGSQKVMSMAR